MNENVMLLYPPGRLFQRSEDRCQTNIDDSAAVSVHACNDLGYAASVLRLSGYNVFLRDYQTENATIGDVKKDLAAFRPALLFFSTTNGTIYDDIAFLEQIFPVCPCKVVVKGALFFDADPDVLQNLSFSHIDCAVGGEVEFVIGRIADALLRQKGALCDVPGVIYKEEGELKKTRFDYFEEDLDSLPFPARDLMNNKLYVRPDTDEMMATISVSRGCPSNCIYCMTPAISGRRLRCRSAENVFEEIGECFYRYGIRNFFFKADTFTFNEHFASALCDRIIRSDLFGKIAFTANGRADRLSPSLLAKMKKAGCFMLAIGFESGSDKSLKLMKKGTTVETNLKAAKMIKAAQIPLFGFFMLGFPWETREDIKATERLIFQIDPDFIELHIAMPYYGTALYDLCREEGTLAGGSFGGDPYNPSTTGTEFLSVEEIQKLKNRMLLRFYLRPKYLLRRGADCLKEPVLIKNYASYGFRLLGNVLKRRRKR